MKEKESRLVGGFGLWSEVIFRNRDGRGRQAKKPVHEEDQTLLSTKLIVAFFEVDDTVLLPDSDSLDKLQNKVS